MNAGLKISFISGGLALLLYLLRKPSITILSTNAQQKSVSYKMSVNGKEITDTFFLGDARQLIEAGDGEYYFYANGNTVTDIVDLAIGYFTKEGAFQAVKGHVVSF